jgi:hypothetical protein
VVSAEWFKTWKAYVGINDEQTPENGPEQKTLQQDFKNLSKNQKKKAKKIEFEIKNLHPGPINNIEQVKHLCIEND